MKMPNTLESSLSNLLKKIGIDTRVKQYQVMVSWPEIVGERISKISSAEKVTNGILFVKVKTSAWRNELIFLKKEILTKIDKKVGYGIIKDIRFI